MTADGVMDVYVLTFGESIIGVHETLEGAQAAGGSHGARVWTKTSDWHWTAIHGDQVAIRWVITRNVVQP